MAVGRNDPRSFRGIIKSVIPFSATVDPASAGAGAEISGTITVTGAAVGDWVILVPGVDQQTLLLNAYVSAANTVEWVLHNETAGAIDLASATWKGFVFQFDDEVGTAGE